MHDKCNVKIDNNLWLYLKTKWLPMNIILWTGLWQCSLNISPYIKMFLHRKSLLKFTYSEYLLCHVHLKSKALTLGIRDVFLFTSFFENGILIRKFNLTFICAHICIILIKIQKGKMYTPYSIPLCYMVSSFPYKFIWPYSF